VTVREWIAARGSAAPPALRERMLRSLDGDADIDASRTAEICLQAARRSLAALVAAGRFGRDSALDLLAIDALTTCAFEHASEVAASVDDLEFFARAATYGLATSMTARG
jgi:hypothetical protein